MTKFFNVFKGDLYESSRLMILGEAHVCGECDPAQCQQMKGKDCLDGHIRLIFQQILKANLPTYKRLEKEFLGHSIESAEERCQFYNQFIITNFLDIAMPQSGMAPEEMFYSEACRERFLNLIRTYQPRCLFVLGDRVWSHLPGDNNDMWGKESINLGNGDSFDLWTLRLEGMEVKTLKLLHPAWRSMTHSHFLRVKRQIQYVMKETGVDKRIYDLTMIPDLSDADILELSKSDPQRQKVMGQQSLRYYGLEDMINY